jgi:cytochrome c oxidase subunit 4
VAFIDLGWLNPILAVAIAAVKATLVLLYFMHLRESDQLTRIFVIAGFALLAILVGLALTDYLTRLGRG